MSELYEVFDILLDYLSYFLYQEKSFFLDNLIIMNIHATNTTGT